MPKKPRAGGRQKGTPNHKYVHAAATPSRCPKCDSTGRLRYYRTRVQTYPGTDPDGQPCTHIIRRWTACSLCGQHRIDRFYEYRPEDPTATLDIPDEEDLSAPDPDPATAPPVKTD